MTLTTLARNLRQQSTDAERMVWQHLRGRRLNGHKFRRQVVIEPYIVDFVCFDAKLIIELDGGQHLEQQKEDDKRTCDLSAKGYRVLRFWNHEVLADMGAVLIQIHEFLCLFPHPNPLPEGEGAKFK